MIFETKYGRQATIALCVLLAFIFFNGIYYDQKMYRDVETLTTQLKTADMPLAEIEAIRSMFLSTSRHTSGFIFLTGFAIVVIVLGVAGADKRSAIESSKADKHEGR